MKKSDSYSTFRSRIAIAQASTRPSSSFGESESTAQSMPERQGEWQQCEASSSSMPTTAGGASNSKPTSTLSDAQQNLASTSSVISPVVRGQSLSVVREEELSAVLAGVPVVEEVKKITAADIEAAARMKTSSQARPLRGSRGQQSDLRTLMQKRQDARLGATSSKLTPTTAGGALVGRTLSTPSTQHRYSSTSSLINPVARRESSGATESNLMAEEVKNVGTANIEASAMMRTSQAHSSRTGQGSQLENTVEMMPERQRVQPGAASSRLTPTTASGTLVGRASSTPAQHRQSSKSSKVISPVARGESTRVPESILVVDDVETIHNEASAIVQGSSQARPSRTYREPPSERTIVIIPERQDVQSGAASSRLTPITASGTLVGRALRTPSPQHRQSSTSSRVMSPVFRGNSLRVPENIPMVEEVETILAADNEASAMMESSSQACPSLIYRGLQPDSALQMMQERQDVQPGAATSSVALAQRIPSTPIQPQGSSIISPATQEGTWEAPTSVAMPEEVKKMTTVNFGASDAMMETLFNGNGPQMRKDEEAVRADVMSPLPQCPIMILDPSLTWAADNGESSGLSIVSVGPRPRRERVRPSKASAETKAIRVLKGTNYTRSPSRLGGSSTAFAASHDNRSPQVSGRSASPQTWWENSSSPRPVPKNRLPYRPSTSADIELASTISPEVQKNKKTGGLSLGSKLSFAKDTASSASKAISRTLNLSKPSPRPIIGRPMPVPSAGPSKQLVKDISSHLRGQTTQPKLKMKAVERTQVSDHLSHSTRCPPKFDRQLKEALKSVSTYKAQAEAHAEQGRMRASEAFDKSEEILVTIAAHLKARDAYQNQLEKAQFATIEERKAMEVTKQALAKLKVLEDEMSCTGRRLGKHSKR